MISYEVYKVLHIMAAFFMLVGLGVGLLHPNPPKFMKIQSGVASLILFVAGMGLLARIGIAHGSGFPGWALAKMFFWVILAVGAPLAAKRVKQGRTTLLYVFLSIAVLAAVFAIYKPF